MPSPLQISQHTLEGIPLVRVSGDLVFGQEVDALPALASALTHQGHTDAILDLAAVTSVDSTGLGAVLAFRRVLSERQGRVYLLHTPDRFRTHLNVTQVESMFTIADGEAELRRLLTDHAHSSE